MVDKSSKAYLILYVVGCQVSSCALALNNFVNFLDSCDTSNEFVAMGLTRLAQIAPTGVIARVLESDADGDGLTLAEELKLGTKATQYDF